MFDKYVVGFTAWAEREHNLWRRTDQGVIIRPFREGVQVRLSVEIDEDTTIDAIRESWWYIRKWREALNEWQPRRPSTEDGFYSRLFDEKRRGLSYSEMADQINQRISELLTEYAEFLARVSEVESQLTTVHDWVSWTHEQDLYGPMWANRDADDLLKLTRPGMTDDERRELLLDALKEVQEGRLPFPQPGNPVMGDDIRARLRQWEKKQEEGVEKTG
jgi:hypothetical protein